MDPLPSDHPLAWLALVFWLVWLGRWHGGNGRLRLQRVRSDSGPRAVRPRAVRPRA
jgi:hypothetical protein